MIRRILAMVLSVHLVIASCLGSVRLVEAMGKNDDADENNLGLLARACSSNFCSPEVNALDIWITFEQVCVQKVQPYLQVFEPEAIEVVTVGSTDLLWSATTTAMFCATLSIMWLFVGYRGGMMIGTRYKGLYPVI